MPTLEEKVKSEVAKHGATIDIVDGETWCLDAPEGFVWSANDAPSILVALDCVAADYERVSYAKWWNAELRFALQDLACGLYEE